MPALTLSQHCDGTITLTIGDGKGRRYFYMSDLDAMHLANRLQSFAKGQHDCPEVIFPRISVKD